MVEDLMAEGRKLMNLGDYDGARDLFNELISREPDNAEAYNKLGVICARQRDFEEAKKCFLKALELKADFSSAASNLGNIFFETGDLDKAEEYYKKAAAMDPDNPVPYNNLAVIYKKQKKIDKYVSFYKKSISLESRRQGNYFDSSGMSESYKPVYGRYWWLLGAIIAVIMYFLLSGR
ncbi:MAG TPA: tetratricopeptide repeat protein [Thermoanaerobacterales bacterium]|nr:tetratricopeptide repeat protein [Thermoanaerobacterales bacterium]